MSTTDKPPAEHATDLVESANIAAAKAADAVKAATTNAEDAIEASVEQIRELNEQAIKAARGTGQRALDAYQAALKSFVDTERNSPRTAPSTGSPRWSPPRPNSPNASVRSA